MLFINWFMRLVRWISGLDSFVWKMIVVGIVWWGSFVCFMFLSVIGRFIEVFGLICFGFGLIILCGEFFLCMFICV